MADAERGQVTHMPSVPDVAPRQDVNPLSAPPTSAPAPQAAPPQNP